ncbi:MAG: hypothetical protein ACJA08_002278 [Cyclobacteriaceae bacterium]|jgi:hypothetical protein
MYLLISIRHFYYINRTNNSQTKINTTLNHSYKNDRLAANSLRKHSSHTRESSIISLTQTK